MILNKKKLYFETQAFTDKLINEISINMSKEKNSSIVMILKPT